MWKNQIALRNVLGDPWPTVQKEEGFGHEIDDRIAMVASMKEVARLGSSTLTRSAETAREIQEQHMHSANADIGYTFKNNTVGPSGPRTPPGGKKGPSGDKAFPMPDKARDPTQDTPMQDPTSCGPGEWEASPGMGMREHLSPVREHMEEGGPASAWPMGERGNTCVVLDGGSKIERMEVPTGRVPPPSPDFLTKKTVAHMWADASGPFMQMIADSDKHLTESQPHRATPLPHASLFATLRQVKQAREDRETLREEDTEQQRIDTRR